MRIILIATLVALFYMGGYSIGVHQERYIRKVVQEVLAVEGFREHIAYNEDRIERLYDQKRPNVIGL